MLCVRKCSYFFKERKIFVNWSLNWFLLFLGGWKVLLKSVSGSLEVGDGIVWCLRILLRKFFVMVSDNEC